MNGRILAGAVAALLLTGYALLHAQGVVEIDTRGKPQTEPTVRVAGGSLKGLPPAAQRSVPSAVDVILSIADPSKIRYGKKFDYALTVMNIGDHNIQLPRSVTWSDVQDRQKREQTYDVCRIFFHLHTPTSFTLMSAGPSLYGSTEHPDTIVVLKPGMSIRILGSTMMAPRAWTPPLPKGKFNVAITAVFKVGSVVLHMGKDGYLNDETQVMDEKSKNVVEVEYQSPPWWTPEPSATDAKHRDEQSRN